MLLSVVVPTKNNHDCISFLVQGFLKWASELRGEIELVIVDNSDKKDTNVESQSGELVNYHWSNDTLDILQNFDRSILLSKGEFVCIIGDDDTVIPTIIDVAKLLKSKKIDSAIAEMIPYYWPSVNTYLVPNNTNGFIEFYTGKPLFEEVNISKSLTKVLKNGGCKYLNILPSAYHSMVKRESLLNLLEKYGTAFPGPSPDISNAILLALEQVSCARVGPFVVSGAKSGSAAAEGASHSHHGHLDTRKSFINRGVFKWPKSAPQFFCGPTMWSVTVSHTLHYADNEKFSNKLNSSSLHAHCLVFHPIYWKNILTSLLEQKLFDILMFPFEVATVCFVRLKFYVINRMKLNRFTSRLTSWETQKNVPNTSEVIQCYLKND